MIGPRVAARYAADRFAAVGLGPQLDEHGAGPVLAVGLTHQPWHLKRPPLSLHTWCELHDETERALGAVTHATSRFIDKDVRLIINPKLEVLRLTRNGCLGIGISYGHRALRNGIRYLPTPLDLCLGSEGAGGLLTYTGSSRHDMREASGG